MKTAQGRLEQYAKDLDLIASHSEAGTTAEMLEAYDYQKLMNSVIESDEIVGIWKGLRENTDAQLVNDLKHVPWGQTMLKD